MQFWLILFKTLIFKLDGFPRSIDIKLNIHVQVLNCLDASLKLLRTLKPIKGLN